MAGGESIPLHWVRFTSGMSSIKRWVRRFFPQTTSWHLQPRLEDSLLSSLEGLASPLRIIVDGSGWLLAVAEKDRLRVSRSIKGPGRGWKFMKRLKQSHLFHEFE